MPKVPYVPRHAERGAAVRASTRLCSVSTAAPIRHQASQRLHRCPKPPPDSAAPPPLPRSAIRLRSVFTAAPSLHQTLQRLHLPQSAIRLRSVFTAAPSLHLTPQRLHRCPEPPSGFAASSPLPRCSRRRRRHPRLALLPQIIADGHCLVILCNLLF